MAEVQNPEEKPAEKSVNLEGGNYEIIRKRLQQHGNDLQERLNQLNKARKEVFGAVEQQLIANNRITTENNCIPRDMIALGDFFIFGYNVHMGLKSEITLPDLFAIYAYHNEAHSFSQKDLTLLQDDSFTADVREMYRFYKDTTFAKFFTKGPYLYFIFQTGKKVDDIKAFKWLVEGDTLKYLDNRSDHEVKYPSQHEFKWQRAHRDFQRQGKFPHVAILDKVFVEATGGDLTIKIEDNTYTGEGIYAEPVEHKDQTLDDAEYFYADLGNLILLKITPFKEENSRYFVFNDKLKQVQRIDKIEEACILLPDNQGIIFSNGYYLQNGELKTFDTLVDHLQFDRRIESPNGEDCMYVFHNDYAGVYVLFSYNIIAQKVESPIICNGFSLFDQGELVYFKTATEPSRNHMLQIWQTPYVSQDYIPPVSEEGFLYKIGNKDLVRGMSECTEVLKLINKEEVYATLYQDLVKRTSSILDNYYWINHQDTFELHLPLQAIRESASTAIEEFEKVSRIQKNTKKQLKETKKKVAEITEFIKRTAFDSIDQFVQALADLRTLRGEAIGLKELRYTDLKLIEALEETLAMQSRRLSEACVNFLLQDNALAPYRTQVKEHEAALTKAKTVAQVNQVEENIEATGQALELLIDIVGNLKIEDATQTTKIIDNITNIYASLNQIKAQARTKKKDLKSVEAVGEFNAQIKLLSQGIINYLDIADTPEKCDEYMTKLMIQLEEMEGKFADFDEFIQQLTEKREEIYNAFEARKLSLVEARNRRANALLSSADRILKGIRTKVGSLKEVEAINAYFASDLMVDKVRDIVARLVEIEDPVKADEIQSRLKTLKEEAVRQLKDKQDIFVDGQNVIQLGRHQFSVSTQNLDLTILQREAAMYYHLTGTGFFEQVTDEAFLATQPVWKQQLVSENDTIYRAEYLAYKIYEAATDKSTRMQTRTQHASVGELSDLEDEALLAYVQKFAANRYQEGYVKGVHDLDASKILKALLHFHQHIDLLRYPTLARAAAHYYWQSIIPTEEKQIIESQLKGIGIILEVFPQNKEFGDVIVELQQRLQHFVEESKLFPDTVGALAGEYLFYEITRADHFIISQEAAEIYEGFLNHLKKGSYKKVFESSLKKLEEGTQARYELIKTWLNAFVSHSDLKVEFVDEFIDETACLLFYDSYQKEQVIQTTIKVDLKGMVGSHPILKEKTYHLHYNDFVLKLSRFDQQVVPQFEHFSALKQSLAAQMREQLRLEEFKPRVLSSFVRNRLIDQVYLPLIGDNLAKQIGVVGENKRTDLMGMLLLISPPGYGKTTLMEYISSRLGLIFMKINGPAIGHHVTSLDPAEAPNASAREELNKLNLAFEMGDNVMIYLDDIQHCHPEFLQKFISLCDGQRRIEGVYKGKPKTYDLRGKKVCVIMAGNPYTESGEKFKIPDMLANRADTYNLGDIIGDTADVFKLSYIENCLTSNPTLNKLATKSQEDVYALIKIAEKGSQEGIDLKGNYASEEVEEFTNVLKKLFVVRDYILKNNLQYIESAAQNDEYRTEPPFKLQGSYRNMNKIAEKIVPIMNEQELLTLILSHYENEAQTLTTGAEANMLKFKEMNELMNETEKARWEEIKETFRRNNKFKGIGAGDQMGQVLVQLNSFSEGLESIRESIDKGIKLSIAKTNKLHDKE